MGNMIEIREWLDALIGIHSVQVATKEFNTQIEACVSNYKEILIFRGIDIIAGELEEVLSVETLRNDNEYASVFFFYRDYKIMQLVKKEKLDELFSSGRC